MADRLFLFQDDDTDTEVTPFEFTGQRGISLEEYRSRPVNFGQEFLQLKELEEETGIDVDVDEDITELADPAERQQEDEEPSDFLRRTLDAPLLGGAEGQVRSDTQVTFYGDDNFPDTGFTSYKDYLNSEAQLADRVNLVQNIIEPAFTDAGSFDLSKAVSGTAKKTGTDVKEGVEGAPSRIERLIKGELTAEDSAKLAGGAMAMTGPVGAVGSTFIGGKTVKNAFGNNSFRPASALGLMADIVHTMQYDHMQRIRAARIDNPFGLKGDTGFAMTIGNYGITRPPGAGTYTGNTRGMNISQLVALEAISKGYDPSNSAGINAFNPKKFDTVQGQGGLFISNNNMDGFFRANGSFYDPRFGRSGAYSTERQAKTAAATAGVSYDEFQKALGVARGTGGKTTLAQAIQNIKFEKARAEQQRKIDERNRQQAAIAAEQERQREIARQREIERRQYELDMRDYGRDDGNDDQQQAREDRERSRVEERVREIQDRGSGRGPGGYRGFVEGGRVGLAMGGAPGMASGFVDRPPEQVPEDQTVADNRPAQLPEGAFVINAAAVEFAGSNDIKDMLLEAHKEAVRRGLTVDKQGNGAKLIDVAISSGEVVVSPHLAKIIGYDRLNKINNRGKPETRERIEENGQAPAPATMQAATGMLISGQLSDPTLTQQDLREQGFLSKEYAPMPDTPIPSRDEDTFFGYTVGELKKAIKGVEIKGFEKNPYIITGAARGKNKSSAFGPMQVTYSTLEDFKKRSPEYKLLDADKKLYVDDLIQQGRDVVNYQKFGAVYRNGKRQKVSKEQAKNLKAYGSGTIDRARHEEHYDVVSDMVLRLKLSDHENIKDALASYGEGQAYANKVLKGLE